jgi:DNA-binding response OmpR family regulator
MVKTRVLFVDDDPSLRTTLPAILEAAGFDVTVASSVHEALAAINSYQFDVLLSDLNIGVQSDGFTVVSAMRRTQPEAVTFILTGYPAFETALQALRAQVDDYLLKPARAHELVAAIRDRLQSRKRLDLQPLRRVSEVLREHRQDVARAWTESVTKDPAFASLNSRAEELERDGIEMIDGILEVVASPEEKRDHPGITILAARRARAMADDGHPPLMLLNEARYMRRCILSVIKRNLLNVELSFVISDMENLAESLDDYVAEALEACLPSGAAGTKVE